MGQPRIGATRLHSSGRYSHDVGACRRRRRPFRRVGRTPIDSRGDGPSEKRTRLGTRRGTFRGIRGRRRAGHPAANLLYRFRQELLERPDIQYPRRHLIALRYGVSRPKVVHPPIEEPLFAPTPSTAIGCCNFNGGHPFKSSLLRPSLGCGHKASQGSNFR